MENTGLWAPAVRTLLSTVRRREEALHAGVSESEAMAYNLACVRLWRGLGLGIRCVMLRYNYLLSWKARSLGKEALQGFTTRKN